MGDGQLQGRNVHGSLLCSAPKRGSETNEPAILVALSPMYTLKRLSAELITLNPMLYNLL